MNKNVFFVLDVTEPIESMKNLSKSLKKGTF